MKDLTTAFSCARALCYFIIVEQFIPGYVYRATCIDKKIVAVLKFIRPTITADGVLNIHELVEHHNTHKKYDNITPVKINELLMDCLSHQGFTLESIPSKDTIVTLTEHSERPNGGYFVDVTDSIPEENRQIIEKAAMLSRLDVIGFDIISKDLSKVHSKEPLTIIEGNSLPFIELHLDVYAGTIYDTPKILSIHEIVNSVGFKISFLASLDSVPEYFVSTFLRPSVFFCLVPSANRFRGASSPAWYHWLDYYWQRRF